jgi:hypothetical protein
MDVQQLGNTVRAKKEKSNFWWPRTDTLEHARDAAKSGSIAFGYIALGALLYAITMFARHLMTAEDRVYSLFLPALAIYLAWRTYRRPTILLNCIAFVLVALVLGMGVNAMLADLATMSVVAPRLCLSILGTLTAVGGIRGSLAVRRFKASAPPAGASAASSEIGVIPEKKARGYFGWPRTDSVESARQAAKGGSVVFGLIAFGELPNLVAIFAGHRTTAKDYIYDGASLLLIALPVYLAWRTYKRPTVLFNCIALAWIALPLGMGIMVMLAANQVNAAAMPRAVDSLCLSIVLAVAAVVGIRGSIAVRRFKASAPSAGAAGAS